MPHFGELYGLEGGGDDGNPEDHILFDENGAIIFDENGLALLDE